MEQLVARRAHNPKVVGSSPTPATNFYFNLIFATKMSKKKIIAGFVAQSVEQWTENPCVGGSIPSKATIFF